MILKGFPRISETFISNEIRLLEDLGFSILIISMRDPGESFTNGSVKRIKAPVSYLPSQLWGNLMRLMWANLNVAVCRPRAYGRALCMSWKKILKSRTIATIKHLLQAGYLAHYALPDQGVTRLHAHSAQSPASVAQFAHVLTGLPFGLTGHAKDIYTQRPQALRDKIRHAQLVVTCTEYNRHYLKTVGGNDVCVHRVYHGIDTSQFVYQGVTPLRDDVFTILCVARMVEKKGLFTILKALAILREQGMRCTFRHVGDGPLKDRLHEEAERLGLSDSVHWLGPRPHEYMPDEYGKADAFVLACQIAENGDRDGIPNVLAESMAVGVPLVATRVSGIPELVEDEATGLLVDPDDSQGLAQALQRVLTDKELRARMIPLARKRVVDMFDNRPCAEELAQVFHEA